MTMQIKTPASIIIAGPSGSGKSTLAIEIVRNADRVLDVPPQHMLWCYSIYQRAFDGLKEKGVRFHRGLPDVDELTRYSSSLLILDDLLHESNETICQIFTRSSHHHKITVIFLTQNIFFNGKHNRTMSLNAGYLFLFRNNRDVTQVGSLARQVMGRHWKHFMEAFEDATKEPYGYLIVDLKADTPVQYRLRTGILPDEIHYVYVKK
jgi:excinuclease UvrABC ATPase subunit